MKSSLPVLSTPVTYAPRRLASWIAKEPEPPPAPLIRTRCPGPAPLVPCCAITPACGIVDASAKVNSAGLRASTDSAAIAYSAKPPLRRRLSPYTSSPGRNRVTAGPTASTHPAISEPSVRRAGERSPPMREYRGEPRRVSQSLRLTEVAAILTSTCPAVGDGLGSCSIRNTPGGPYRSYTTALIRVPLILRRSGQRCTRCVNGQRPHVICNTPGQALAGEDDRRSAGRYCATWSTPRR